MIALMKKKKWISVVLCITLMLGASVVTWAALNEAFSPRLVSTAGGEGAPALVTDVYDLNGDGVKDPAYEISNAAELEWFAAYVNDDHGNTNAVLVRDIDLSGYTHTPIGVNYSDFAGIFDGRGYTISNMRFTTVQNGYDGNLTYDYQGLFGVIIGGAVVRNFTVEGEIVLAADGQKYIGGAVGLAYQASKIQNVTSYVDINDAGKAYKNIAQIGGVVGQLGNTHRVNTSASIENCKYYGTIHVDTAASVGGIAGQGIQNSSVLNCTNYGTVGWNYIGHAGGVIGSAQSGTQVKQCVNYGSVSIIRNDCVGGVAGYANENVVIMDCANFGAVTAKKSDVADEPNVYLGGILGYVNNENFGYVNGQLVGGVVGCFNYGTVVDGDGNNSYTGAIVGYVNRNTKTNAIKDNFYREGSCVAAYGKSGQQPAEPKIAQPVTDGDTVSWGYNAYIVEGNVTIQHVGTSGRVALFLKDGAHLTINNGLSVNVGITLSIYAESEPVLNADGTLNETQTKTGRLTVQEKYGSAAAIGASGPVGAGTITIHGGIVTATAGVDRGTSGRSPAIGGSDSAACGDVTINGGYVTATGSAEAAAIGNGAAHSGGCVTINGGTVIATGGWMYTNAGLGGYWESENACTEVKINGGRITATAGLYGICAKLEVTNFESLSVAATQTTSDDGTPAAFYGLQSFLGGRYHISTGDSLDALTPADYGSEAYNNYTSSRAVRLERGHEHKIPWGWIDDSQHGVDCPWCGYQNVEAHSIGEDSYCAGCHTWSGTVYGFQAYAYEHRSTNILTSTSTVWTATSDDSGHYVVVGDLTIDGRVQVTDSATLILADNATLTVTGGIEIAAGKSLAVTAASMPVYAADGSLDESATKTGRLVTTAAADHAAISVPKDASLYVRGGIISATGGNYAAGIGGDRNSSVGYIRIDSGDVTATGGDYAAGIGLGYCSNDYSDYWVDLYAWGGVVTAQGGIGGDGIGAGATMVGSLSYIAAYKGTITAVGGDAGQLNGQVIPAGKALNREARLDDELEYQILAGDSVTALTPVAYEDRDSVYTTRRAVRIQQCSSHVAGVAVYKNDTQHSIACTWCHHEDHAEAHSFDETTHLCVCGAREVSYLAFDTAKGQFVTRKAGVLPLPTDGKEYLASGWYIVEGTVTRGGARVNAGPVHLILADDADLTINGSIDNWGSTGSFAVYAQSQPQYTTGDQLDTSNTKTGKLTVKYGIDTTASIHGGILSVTYDGWGEAMGGDISIYGGDISLVGGIEYDSEGNIQLEYRALDSYSTVTLGPVKTLVGATLDALTPIPHSEASATLADSDTVYHAARFLSCSTHELGYGVYLDESTHSLFCKWCNSTYETGAHTFDADGRCVCGAANASYLEYDAKAKSFVTKKVIARPLTEDTAVWSSGWYIVHGDVTLDAVDDWGDTIPLRAVVSGDVKLILADGAHLNVTGGISLTQGNSLTVYAQSQPLYKQDGTLDTENTKTGKLTATGRSACAGIGGDASSDQETDPDGSARHAGTVVFHGGIISATGDVDSAGIGGSNAYSYEQEKWVGGNAGSITVWGGHIYAQNGRNAFSIGGGADGQGGEINIWGGTVMVSDSIGCTAGEDAPGSINIHGGRVTAPGSIGGEKATVTINDGEVTVSGSQGVGIGGQKATVTIHDGTVTVTRETDAEEGIGGYEAKVTIHGGTVTANGGEYSDGIGGASATVTVNGGTITANGGEYSAGIGGEQATITINGGTINAAGGNYGAGVGGYRSTTNIYGGSITVSANAEDSDGFGGTYAKTIVWGVDLTAIGSAGGAGINGDLIVYGDSEVTATGGTGISGRLTIYGGKVTATGSPDGTGIASATIISGQVIASGKRAFATAPTFKTDYRFELGDSLDSLVATPYGQAQVDCTTKKVARLVPCTSHEAGATYKDDTQHTLSCKWCGHDLDEVGAHYYDEQTGLCICGAWKGSYLSYDPDRKLFTSQTTSATVLTSTTQSWTAGWYVVRDDLTINSRVTVTGDVKLILADGATLTVNGGISAGKGTSFTVYAQSRPQYKADGSLDEELTTTGKLILQGVGDCNAALGGDRDGVGGNITIHGGILKATSGRYAAGIGGGDKGKDTGMEITIYDGDVTAIGVSGGTGIGGGDGGAAGTITIYGGTVNASGASGNAGIGSGDGGTAGTITIYDGRVTALGGGYAAGIGGGQNVSGGTISILGGTVEATGRSDGAGIGGGKGGHAGNITISGGTVTAIGDGEGAGIGGGSGGSIGTINISGGTIHATSGSGTYAGAGIGGGGRVYRSEKTDITITISNATVTAIGRGDTGIGHGESTYGVANITINSGTVVASGERSGVGCADGYSGTDIVTINGGSVTSVSTSGDSKFRVIPTYKSTLNWKMSFGDTLERLWTVLHSDKKDTFFKGEMVYRIEVCPDVHSTDPLIYVDGETHSGTACWWCGDAHTASHSFDETTHLCACGAEEIDYLAFDTARGQYVARTAGALTLPTGTTWSAGWYVVRDTVALNGSVTVSGDVHLILADGADLTVTGGIVVDAGNSLSIYAQSQASATSATGKLTVTNNATGLPAIGGSGRSVGAGNLTIHGGVINATASGNAGIGSGNDLSKSAGTITIHGGLVNATGTQVGIGGLLKDTAIIINGGTVTAKGGNGTTCFGLQGHITINGGSVLSVGSRPFSYTGAQVTLTVNCPHKLSNGASLDALTGVAHTDKEVGYNEKPAASITACDHEYTYIYKDGHCHTATCKWCGDAQDMAHTSGQDQVCVCGYWTGTYEEYIPGIGQYVTKTTGAKLLTENDTEWTTGWYVVAGKGLLNSQLTLDWVTVSGDVHLILTDSTELVVQDGIYLPEGSSLTIYAQSHPTAGNGEVVKENEIGSLIVKASGQKTLFAYAGIGCHVSTTETVEEGVQANAGTLTIHGGKLTVAGSGSGAGIGGAGADGQGGQVTIYGGQVNATGGTGADGISGTVTICGSAEVTAIGGAGGKAFSSTPTIKGSFKLTESSTGTGSYTAVDHVGKTGAFQSLAVQIRPCTAHTIGSKTFVDTDVHIGVCKWCGDTYRHPHDEDYETVTCGCGYGNASYLVYDPTTGKWETKTHIAIQLTGTETTWQKDTWYVAIGNVTIDSRVVVEGQVHLILSDGATLTIHGGIQLAEENALHIYAQSQPVLKADGSLDEAQTKTGRLIIDGVAGGALYVYGGRLSAVATGFDYGISSAVTFYGGDLYVVAPGDELGFAFASAPTFGEGLLYRVFTGDQEDTALTPVLHADKQDSTFTGNWQVRITTCTDHSYTYTELKNGQHRAACQWCGNSYTEAHKSSGVVYKNETTHWAYCGDCHANFEEAHTAEGLCACGAWHGTYRVFDPATRSFVEQTGAAIALTAKDTTWQSGWYVVTGTMSIRERVTVEGDVRLILADGASLTVVGGIDVTAAEGETRSLTIYAQSEGSAGALVVEGVADGYAGIGSQPGQGVGDIAVQPASAGSITIHGGTITTTGGSGGAGIGGGRYANGGTILIYGGAITANGGPVESSGSGTGGFSPIIGGEGFQPLGRAGSLVSSTEENGGSGIGAGYGGTSATIQIGSATVEANGGTNAKAFSHEPTFLTDLKVGEKGATGLSSWILVSCADRLTTCTGKQSVLVSPCVSHNWENDQCTYCGSIKVVQADYLVYEPDSKTFESETANARVLGNRFTTWTSGWYIVQGDLTIDGRVTVSGDVHLILADGASLTITDGIKVTTGSLTVYAQSTGVNAGRLMLKTEATEQSGYVGDLTVHGGTLSFSASKTRLHGIDGNTVMYGGDLLIEVGPSGRYCVNGSFTLYGGTLSLDTSSMVSAFSQAPTLAGDTGWKVSKADKVYPIRTQVLHTEKTDKLYHGNDSLVFEPCTEHSLERTYTETTHTLTCKWCGWSDTGAHTNTETEPCSCGYVGDRTYLAYDPDKKQFETRTAKNVFALRSTDLTWSSGWYIAQGDVTIDGMATVSGDVHLILADGASLTITDGITVTTGSLTVYAQSSTGDSIGKLTVKTSTGVRNGLTGDLIIHGGTLSIDCSISGGGSGIQGNTTMYGGGLTVTAGSNEYCVSGSFTLYGGTLVADTRGYSTALLKAPTLAGDVCWKISQDNGSGWTPVRHADKGSLNYVSSTSFQIQPCTQHERDESGAFYKDEQLHTCVCKWCGSEFDEPHTAGENGQCDCGIRQYTYLEYDTTTKTFVTKATPATLVTSSDTEWTAGWYIVTGSVKITGRVTVTGDVKLILADGASLTVKTGITVNEGNSFTIYAQSQPLVKADGTLDSSASLGKLSVTNFLSDAAGIGGYNASSGQITIHGGQVTVNEANNAGIGGGYYGNGHVTIYGGYITAKGYYGAGIGGGRGGAGYVTIHGGHVTANGGPGSYEDGVVGIGNGKGGSGGSVTINGGTVTATGGGIIDEDGGGAAGIGASGGCSVTITINGGTVTATGAGEAMAFSVTPTFGTGSRLVYVGDSPDLLLQVATVTDELYTSRQSVRIRYTLVSMDISWTAMEFTYTDGAWDADTHTYTDGGWQTTGGTVTVTNRSNIGMTASFAFVPTLEGLSGSFSKQLLILGIGESGTTTLSLSGKPTQALEGARLGDLTITLDLAQEGWMLGQNGLPAYCQDGQALTGWQTIEGKLYYLHPDWDGAPAGGWTLIDGVYYELSSEGVLWTGFYTDGNGDTYYYRNGQKVTGWLWQGDKCYYFDSDTGIRLTGGTHQIGGREVLLADDGSVQTGLAGNSYIYYFKDGVLQEGFQILDGKTYYFWEDGDPWMEHNDDIRQIRGKYYLFGADGVLKTGGWVQNGRNWTFYADENGVLQLGWLVLDGNTYYIDAFGRKEGHSREIDGKSYSFDGNGCIETGWREEDEARYYHDENGAMVTGLRQIDGKLYYFSTRESYEYRGKMQTGTYTIDGFTYTFGEDGAMTTGWLVDGESICYYQDGVKLTGSGHSLTDGVNTEPCSFDEDGNLLTGIYLAADGWIYSRTDGVDVIYTGWRTEEGQRYYYELGVKKTDCLVTTRDGKIYCFDENGIPRTNYEYHETYQDGSYYYNSNFYYFDENGESVSDRIVGINGQAYYYSGTGNCDMHAGGVVRFESGDYAYYDYEGHLCTNLLAWYQGYLYFFGADGKPVTGLIYLDEDKVSWDQVGLYYFDADKNGAAMMSARFELDGEEYYFGYDGRALTNCAYTNYSGETRIYDENGHICTGLVELNGETYYCDPDTGVVQTGILLVGDACYYFSPEIKDDVGDTIVQKGQRLYGWQKVDGKLYYFDPLTGAMLKTPQATIEDYDCSFYPDGSLRTGPAEVRNWDLDAWFFYYYRDGVMQTDCWVEINGNQYYFDEDGHAS